MTAAVENLILKVRKEAALKEKEIAEQKKLQAKKEAETQKKLTKSAMKSLEAHDDFIDGLKKTKKTLYDP